MEENTILLYLNGERACPYELREVMANLKDNEVLELVEIDYHCNLHFEVNAYGLYY